MNELKQGVVDFDQVSKPIVGPSDWSIAHYGVDGVVIGVKCKF
jgi:hypothetical protein